MRINKYLAECGLGSRRFVENLILEGKICLNGKVVTELSTLVDVESDVVEHEGRVVKREENKIYIMLNKPIKYITSVKDDRGRDTIMKLLKNVSSRVFPVGRLDYFSEGLLLITNDGDFTNSILHPKQKIEKTYLVDTNKPITKEDIERLKKGIVLDGIKTLPAKVNLHSKDKKTLQITISEGRNRQIRRMLEYLQYKVLRLQRISIGGLKLNNLKVGEYIYLKPEHIKKIFE